MFTGAEWLYQGGTRWVRVNKNNKNLIRIKTDNKAETAMSRIQVVKENH